MPSFIKSKWIWAATIVALLVGGYALLGFVVAPNLIRSQAIAFVAQEYHRTLLIGEVRLQPFALQLDIADVALPDRDGSTMLGFKRLFVDFEVSSLWHRAFVFKEVTLQAPLVRGVVHADGSLNFADLAPKHPAKEEKQSELPRVWIQALTVRQGTAEFADFSRALALQRSLAPIDFALRDFRTTAEGGGFHFSARSPVGEAFDWRGRFALQPVINSQGNFAFANIRAPGLADFAGDALPFSVRDGVVKLAGDYRFALGKNINLQVRVPSFALSNLSLRAQGADEDWVRLPNLLVSGTSVDLGKRAVSVQAITLSGLSVKAWLAGNGTVNLVQMFTPYKRAPAKGVPAITALPANSAVASPQSSSPPWKLQLVDFALQSATVNFDDLSGSGAKHFAITPINVDVRNISLDLSQPLPTNLQATINGHAHLNVTGSVTPEPLAADVKVTLTDLGLKMLQPYVAPFADLSIGSGALGVHGEVQLATPANRASKVNFAGDVEVKDFRSTDNLDKEDFINLRLLQLRGLRFSQTPSALSIDRVLVKGPYARVVVGPGGNLNVVNVLNPHGASPSRATPAAADKSAHSASTVMAIRVREVRFDSGRLSFADHSIQPKFAAQVQDLHGAVTGLSNDAHDPKAAKVDLAGNLGEFSPVHIFGSLQPFSYDRATDLSLKFENISLPVFNPYSGRFAGYNIAKGKLTTDLRYQIQQRKLNATHKVRIDQLQWGDATASKDAASLPVKLATALLKDRTGVINLDIPVAGSLDDPKLKIWPIIWQVLTNLIAKAVAAPFDLLGSMFAGAEKAQFVVFAPGDSVLDPVAAERLHALAKGLAERDVIQLDVPFGVSDSLDRPALIDDALNAQLIAVVQEQRGDEEGSKATPPISFTALPMAQRIDALKALVVKLAGKLPAPSPPPAALDNASRAEVKAAREAGEIAGLTAAARTHIVVPDGALDTLARKRSDVIQHALLSDTGLAPTRVFVVKNGKVTEKDGKVQLELGMHSG